MDIVERIYKSLEDAQATTPTRSYLGMSGLGHGCLRKLWSDWRWLNLSNKKAEVLLKFDDGFASEDITAARIRVALPEATLITHKPNGEQVGFIDLCGHLRGHIDGTALGLPEFEDEWVIWEHKCSDRVVANKLERGILKHGMHCALEQWNWVYYCQAILYMYYSKLDHHFMTVSHSGSRAYIYVITPADNKLAETLIEKASMVIASDKPPEKISDKRDFFMCNMCDNQPTCFDHKSPYVSCRSCIHSSPVINMQDDKGDGQWLCELNDKTIEKAVQKVGCGEHLFIPELLDTWADFIGAHPVHNAIEYLNKLNGNTFYNGSGDISFFTSNDMFACDTQMLGDPNLDDIISTFDAVIEKE